CLAIELFWDHAEVLEALGLSRQAISGGNERRLRAFLETWFREPLTPAAWHRGAGVDLSFFDPDVIYEDTVLPDHADEAYRGPEGVMRPAERWLDPWEWLVVDLERIEGVRDRLVSIHRARSKARQTGIEFESALAYVWTFRDGKVVHFKSFMDPAQALEAAGLSE
ncbi:MAG TPA: nuclear transport factor 2 family protein, partial [Solirubrobacterales bacterium]